MRRVHAEAFGRVNLIGEHTDYNQGWVLPTLIPQKTEVELRVQKDRGPEVHAVTDDMLEAKRALGYILGRETPTKTWIDYLQGATCFLREAGFSMTGFDVSIQSTVPVGSGLSSSAALEISFMKALRQAFELKLDDIAIAKLGQKIENEFVGARVGIMDQMACSVCRPGEALFLDTKDLSYEFIPLPLDAMDLLVINSGVQHQHAGGDYNRRRSECEEACKHLKVASLRELGIQDLPRLKSLPEVLERRARHVVTENQRVHDAVEALRARDLPRLGKLFYESHASMREDYQVSIPEIDTLVQLCGDDPSVYGARLTGGGFGGSIVAVTKKGTAAAIGGRVVLDYNRRTSHEATVLVS